jgi:hypothetical protein
MIWSGPDMSKEAKPFGKRARQAGLTIKVVFGLALRQTTGFAESLLTLIGLDWSVPDFSTLCRRQQSLAVIIDEAGWRRK